MGAADRPVRAAAYVAGASSSSASRRSWSSGPSTVGDYVALLARVSAPVTTPHNFTPGAVAFQAGVSEAVASAIQLATVVFAVVAVLVAIRVADDEASYLVAVVATQLVSPLLWDHYAVLLLLPVAWLLDRGQWWAALLPLATALPVLGIVPAAVYPIEFAICLVAPILGRAARPRRPRPPAACRSRCHEARDDVGPDRPRLRWSSSGSSPRSCTGCT